MCSLRVVFMSNCSLICHFCSTSDMRKTEKVQNTALKCIFNDFKTSYYDLLARSHIQLLYIQRQRAILEEVYNIYHSICPAYVNELLESVQKMYGTRNKCDIVQIKMQNEKMWFKRIYV